jgi:dihydrodipicolinate synthase/N-acetylneuraminate lyase
VATKRGVIAPILTPFNDDGSLALDLYIAHAKWLFDQGDVDAARALHEKVQQFRLTIEQHAPIPAQKRLLAIAGGDRRWANVRPPLCAMAEATGRELAAELKDRRFSLDVEA